tara:strand:+ start:8194 stop:9729 length:1536 start_codon:yes stop_codon:yes gene_type:complete
MNIYQSLRPWLGRKAIRGAIVVTVIALAAVIVFGDKEGDDKEIEKTNPLVSVTTASEYLGGESVSLVGSVRAFTEAAITSEVSGRAVSVNVALGQNVSAGQILITLENASEQASVLQAEGAYETALAAAAQTNIGTDEANTVVNNAKNNAVTAFKAAYNTNNGVIRNSVDTFFSTPDATITGLKIDGRGFTDSLNSERVAYQDILAAWQTSVNTISSNSDLETELSYASEVTQRTIALVDRFITVFNNQPAQTGRYSESDFISFSSSFTNLRANLIATQSNLDAAASGLVSAKSALERAELAASGSVYSSADAQVKQALGSLRAAQAQLAKTIIRTPISGTVNSLSVRTGDFVNSFGLVAEVANNSVLEVVTYVGDTERELLSVGSMVLIENQYEGIITEIAPAVDANTRKTEVRIAAETDELQNGDTVTISKEIEAFNTKVVMVPLSAVKFELEDGSMFLIEDKKLIKRPVTLGVVRGGSVEVVDGLAATEEFVVDVRGLLVGTEVDITE